MRLERIIGTFSIFIVYYLMWSISTAGDIPYYKADQYINDTEGGLSGSVIKVTNLNNDGPGSFKEACEDSGARLVVFKVGGVIDLELNTINITSPYLIIAGQTAPHPGITLIKGALTIRTHNVVVQHIAVRPGDATVNMDAISIGSASTDVHHVILDHCSATWSTDENLSLVNTFNNHDITLFKCLISEGLNFDDHSCGSLIYGNIRNLYIIGCLYAHNVRRNPRINNNTEFVLANNIFYNWGSFSDNSGEYANCVHLREARGTIVGNFVLGGNDTQDSGSGLYFVRGHDGEYQGEAYFENNLLKHADGQSAIKENDHLISRLENKPLWPEDFIPKTVPESVNDVLRTVGARAGERDPIDNRIVKSVINRTGAIINRQSEVEDYPQYPMTKRSLTVPNSVEQRCKWLDSLSAAINIDESLDTSPLIPVLTGININEYQRDQYYGYHLINTPNPFNPITDIQYGLIEDSDIALRVFNMKGQVVKTLIENRQSAGNFSIPWDATDNQGNRVTSDLYVYELKSSDKIIRKKMILLQ